MPNNVKRYPLQRSPFYRLSSRRKLAELLGLSEHELRRLAEMDNLYTYFSVPKKNGGNRPVENPRPELKRVQAAIARLLSRIEPPDYLFCPIKGRSYVSNAARHRDSREIYSLDIQSYFPNTPSRRVFTFFHQVMLCPRDVAAILSRLACHKGHLPTGSPLSPIMAHFAYLDVWEKIAAIGRDNHCLVSVYIDDLTISGERVAEATIWEIKRIIHAAGLRYHKEKHAIERPAEITGVIVRDGKLLVPNRQRLKLRNLEIAKNTHPQPIVLARKIAGLRSQMSQIISR